MFVLNTFNFTDLLLINIRMKLFRDVSPSITVTVQRGVIKPAARDKARREAWCQANFQPDFEASC